MEYCRGDIYYVNQKTLYRINDPKFERPAVIVSSDYGNENGRNVTVVYLTTEEKRPMRVHVNVMCRVPSTAMCENIETIPKTMLGQYVRTCTAEEMQRIDQGIRYALNLNQPAPDMSGNAYRIMELEALLEAEKANVSVLRNNLKEKDAIIKAKDARIDALAVDLAAMEQEMNQAEETRDVVNLDHHVELTRVQTERDVYKRLFEQFFDLKKEA